MRSNFFYGILVGLIIGCLVGFLIFKSPKSKTPTSSTANNQISGQPNSGLNTEYVCPCKSWSTKHLPAPEWKPEMLKPDLKTDFHGRISFKWRPVDGTRYYIVYFQDKSGKELLVKKTGVEGLNVEGTIPLPEGVSEGHVLASVAAANANKEPGSRSIKLDVLVRAPVSTVAPIIKDIKVEE